MHNPFGKSYTPKPSKKEDGDLGIKPIHDAVKEELERLRSKIEFEEKVEYFNFKNSPSGEVWTRLFESGPLVNNELLIYGGGNGGGIPPQFRPSDGSFDPEEERRMARLEQAERLNDIFLGFRQELGQIMSTINISWREIINNHPELEYLLESIKQLGLQVIDGMNIILESILKSKQELRVYETAEYLLDNGVWQHEYVSKLKRFVMEIEDLFKELVASYKTLGNIHYKKGQLPSFIKIIAPIRLTEILEIYSSLKIVSSYLNQGDDASISIDYDGAFFDSKEYFIRSFAIPDKNIYGLRKIGNRHYDKNEIDLTVFNLTTNKISIIDSKLKISMLNPSKKQAYQQYRYFNNIKHLIDYPNDNNSINEKNLLGILSKKIKSIKLPYIGKLLCDTDIENKFTRYQNSSLLTGNKLILSVMNLKSIKTGSFGDFLLGQKHGIKTYNFMSSKLDLSSII